MSKSASFLLISAESGEKVFDIKTDGSVWWYRDGSFVQARTNRDLGKALGLALIQMVEINSALEKKLHEST